MLRLFAVSTSFGKREEGEGRRKRKVEEGREERREERGGRRGEEEEGRREYIFGRK